MHNRFGSILSHKVAIMCSSIGREILPRWEFILKAHTLELNVCKLADKRHLNCHSFFFFSFFYILVFSLVVAGAVTIGLYFVHNSIENLILSCIFEALTSLGISTVYCVMVDLFPTNLRWTIKYAFDIISIVNFTLNFNDIPSATAHQLLIVSPFIVL